jgi:hypothetical protein
MTILSIFCYPDGWGRTLKMQIPRRASGRMKCKSKAFARLKEGRVADPTLAEWPPRRGQAQRKRRLIGGGAQPCGPN